MLICKNRKITQTDVEKGYTALMRAKPFVKYDGHGVGSFSGKELLKVRRMLENSRASRTRYVKLLYWLDKNNDIIQKLTPAERYVLYHAINARPTIEVLRRQLYYLNQYRKKVERQ